MFTDGVTLSFIFSGGAPIWLTVTIGLGQVILGVLVGVLVGEGLAVACWPLPKHAGTTTGALCCSSSSNSRASSDFDGQGGGVRAVSDLSRFQLVLLSACLCIFGGGSAGMSGGGTLAVVVIGIYINEVRQSVILPVSLDASSPSVVHLLNISCLVKQP
jgi:hypothetical protein